MQCRDDVIVQSDIWRCYQTQSNVWKMKEKGAIQLRKTEGAEIL